MFGYVKPFIPDLRIKEYEFYRSVYCGLCRSMSRHTTLVSSATLSYDIVFFALIRLALTSEKYTITRKRCIVHPLKKRPAMSDSPALEYTAYINSILVYYKLKDNISDEKGLGKIPSAFLLPYAKNMKKKAKIPESIEMEAAECIGKLKQAENDKCPSPDFPADIFGEMMSLFTSFGLEGKNETIAKEIGRHLGRWVYIADAVCDYSKDKKTGSYNPFVYAFENDEAMEKFKSEQLDAILTPELCEIEKAVNLIDFTGREMLYECIKNIINCGMRNALTISMKEGK